MNFQSNSEFGCPEKTNYLMVNEEILVDKHEGWWRIIHEGFSFMENAFMDIINPSSLREEVGMARISNQKTLVAFFNCVEIISRSDSDEIQLKPCLPEFIEHEKRHTIRGPITYYLASLKKMFYMSEIP